MNQDFSSNDNKYYFIKVLSIEGVKVSAYPLWVGKKQ